MKRIFIVTYLLCFLFLACKKANVNTEQLSRAEQHSSVSKEASGSGSGGSGGGGGGTTTGLLQNVLSGSASRLIAGTTDSIWVNFTQPAAANGWTINLTSSNPAAIQVPSTYFVAPGQTTVHPPVTGGAVSNASNVTITIRLNSESKTTVLKVFPLNAVFPAPQLQSPGNGSNFKSRTIIDFTWNANNNAYFYHLQIANNTAFTSPETDLYLNDPFWRQSAFVATTNYWRVRYVAAGGGVGPWSEVRSFTIRPQ